MDSGSITIPGFIFYHEEGTMAFMETDANAPEIEVNLFSLSTEFGQQIIFVSMRRKQ